MVATATATATETRVSRKKASKADLPDPAQLRLKDEETGQFITNKYHNPEIDKAFTVVRDIEDRIAALVTKLKRAKVDFLDIMKVEEAEIREKNDGLPYIAMDSHGQPYEIQLKHVTKVSSRKSKLKVVSDE